MEGLKHNKKTLSDESVFSYKLMFLAARSDIFSTAEAENKKENIRQK